MTSYKCDRCAKEFKQKIDYQRHLNRKNPCPEIDPNLECDLCHKIYANNSNLTRHTMKFHSLEIECNNFSKSSNENLKALQIDKALNNNTHCCDDCCIKDASKKTCTKSAPNLVNLKKTCTKSAPKLVHLEKTCIVNTFKTNYQCDHCLLYFSRSTTLKRHISNNCKVKKQQELEKEENTSQLLQEMQEEIKQLKDCVNDVIISINDITNGTIIAFTN